MFSYRVRRRRMRGLHCYGQQIHQETLKKKIWLFVLISVKHICPLSIVILNLSSRIQDNLWDAGCCKRTTGPLADLTLIEGWKHFTVWCNQMGIFYAEMSSRTSWDEDNILNQIYYSKCVRIIIMMILILFNTIRKCIQTLQKHLNPIFEFLAVM